MTTTAPDALIGTPRQIEWAAKIRSEYRKLYGATRLPEIPSAHYWIENRTADLAALHELAETWPFDSPFTAIYPRIGRDQAIATLRLPAKTGYSVLDTETTALARRRKLLTWRSAMDRAGRSV